jgi:hypothetical protein
MRGIARFGTRLCWATHSVAATIIDVSGVLASIDGDGSAVLVLIGF